MEGNDSTLRRRALLTELVPAPAALLRKVGLALEANAAQVLRGTQLHNQVYPYQKRMGFCRVLTASSQTPDIGG
jgi:hypothetical protein